MILSGCCGIYFTTRLQVGSILVQYFLILFFGSLIVFGGLIITGKASIRDRKFSFINFLIGVMVGSLITQFVIHMTHRPDMEKLQKIERSLSEKNATISQGVSIKK